MSPSNNLEVGKHFTSKLNRDAPSTDKAECAGNSLVLTQEQCIVYARENHDKKRSIYLTFSPRDVENPRQWSQARKWYITCFVSSLNVLTCLCAGGYSSGASQIAQEFSASSEVVVLGLSMYVLGLGLGPLILAPLSEHWGRSPIYVWSFLLLTLLHIPLALAPNMTTIIVVRLLQGIAGSAPVTNAGGTVSDLWERDGSGIAMAIYGLSSTAGPPLALVISGYIAQNLGWRKLIWIHMAIIGTFWLILTCTLQETRHSVILHRRTLKIRKLIADERLLPPADIKEIGAEDSRKLTKLFKVTLTRPIRFLFTEPITSCAAIYNGFIYGIVFLFNEAFPLVFGNLHHFNTGEWGLSFLGLCIGSLIAAFLHPVQERYYMRHVAQTSGRSSPEARLWLACYGAFLLPVSLFWFAWTSVEGVHWIVPIIASAIFGIGIFIIILGILNYIVDSYQTYSASSLAGVVLVRNIVGASFPPFAEQMYRKLGYPWASSLLAFLSTLLIPIPFVFLYKGELLRARSPWARRNFYACSKDAPMRKDAMMVGNTCFGGCRANSKGTFDERPASSGMVGADAGVRRVLGDEEMAE